MPHSPIRVLFTNWVDLYNYNAQSLNVREIALRLNPERFRSTLFYEKTPDPRLLNCPSIRLIKIAPRLGTLRILAEALRGHDILFRANLIRFTYIYLSFPSWLRRGSAMIEWMEGPTKQYLRWESYRLEGLYKFVQARVPYHVAMTEYVAKANFEDYGIRTDAFIPVGVKTRHFIPPRTRNNAMPVVLFVSTLIERKNPHAVLIAARHFPNAQFIIVGPRRGDYYRRLERLMNKWKLNNVIFLGAMGHEQLLKVMQQSDILFHPSKVESIAKVVLEGGATGLPGIMYEYYHSPAVLDGVTGFQVKDFDEMMGRLGLLIENRELRQRMGAAAVEYVKQFDWDIVTSQWEQVFLRVAGELQ